MVDRDNKLGKSSHSCGKLSECRENALLLRMLLMMSKTSICVASPILVVFG